MLDMNKLFYWLRYHWHKVSGAKKFRYQHKDGSWSSKVDYFSARIDLERPTLYTGKIEYDPSPELKIENKIVVLHPRKP